MNFLKLKKNLKWYGYSIHPVTSLITDKKIKFKRKCKRSSFLMRNRMNFNFFKITLYLPVTWNFLIIKKKNEVNYKHYYIYSTTYFFLIPFLYKFLMFYYDKQINVLSFRFFFRNNYYLLFWNFFKIFFYSFSRVFFLKLKFKGKGYYIYKNKRNTIAFQFGYSHIKYLYSFSIFVKFITKTIILLFGINKLNVRKKSHALFSVRSINVFTGKGIRFSKQIIYKKVGKVSSYR